MAAGISGSDGVPAQPPDRDVWKSDRVNAFSWAALFCGAPLLFWRRRLRGMRAMTGGMAGASSSSEPGVSVVGVLCDCGLVDHGQVGWTLMWAIVFLSFGLSVFYGPAWLALVLLALAVATVAGALRNTG